jgi:radical SAM/Cys-rich protein
MDSFEQSCTKTLGQPICAAELGTLQVNLGLRCNQSCAHCHLEASPARAEAMDWPTMEQVFRAARDCRCRLVDVTGGAPELNPHFRRFIVRLRGDGFAVQVRTNLTVLLEPGMQDLPEFFSSHGVQLVASMPCYTEENVRAQRGAGVYERSVAALRRLNALGYGVDERRILNLVYNPGGAFLPGGQAGLEADYRRELNARFGIRFTRLLTIANMPLGRFREALRRDGQEEDYKQLLRAAFNPQTLDGLMCRSQLSVGWDGTLYDCDFNLALGRPVNHGAPSHLRQFDSDALARRRIMTGDHCYGCTAGSGSSCGGALVRED